MTSYPDTVFRTTSWISSPAFSPFPYIGENFATFFINYSTSSKGPPTSPEEDISLTTSAQSSVESPTPKGSYLDSQTAFLEPFHKSQVSRLFTCKNNDFISISLPIVFSTPEGVIFSLKLFSKESVLLLF